MANRHESLLLAYSAACADTGHAICRDPEACEDLAGYAERSTRFAQRSADYDARLLAIEGRGTIPDHTWKISALMARVEDLLHTQPNLDGPFRTVAITTCLARLGERGISPDWLVRSQVGPSLIRRIILAAASVWHDVHVGRLSRDQVPELRGWLAGVDMDAPAAYSPERDRARLITSCLAGETLERGARWIGEASMSDIAAWRIDDYTMSPPQLDDMSLPGGSAAARWLYERFMRTYHTEWSPESWVWEAAYLEHPESVAERAGIDLSILKERISTPAQLTKAASSYVLNGLGDILPGMGRNEFIELVVHHLEHDSHADARAISEAAFAAHPSDNTVRSVYAFCWLPMAPPQRCREILETTRENRTMSDAVRRANIVCTYLAEDDLTRAQREVLLLEDAARGVDQPAWLWDPRSLASRPRIIYSAPEEWVLLAESHLRS